MHVPQSHTHMHSYLKQVGANSRKIGKQAYASACIKTILAAHTSDHAEYPVFGEIVTAAETVLPRDHPVLTALKAPGADDNWQSHIGVLTKFGDMSPEVVANELKYAAGLAKNVGQEAAQVYPIAVADRVCYHDQNKTNAYAKAIKNALE